MINMHFTVLGEPRTKKNSSRIIRVRTKTGGCYNKVMPSKAFERYQSECGLYMPHIDAPIDVPVNLKCVYYMGSGRRVDLLNLLNATADMLVYYGVLADDNRNIVYSVDGSRVHYDKKNPRVEIAITNAEYFEDCGKG